MAWARKDFTVFAVVFAVLFALAKLVEYAAP